MGFYEPKRGDRVRVVLEGEANSLDVSRREKCFGIGANYINPENEHVMSVEKVEPPVVRFKPGDVVRWIAYPGGGTYTLGENGRVFSHRDGTWMPSGHPVTSEKYERL